ncbi:MAG: hypothetical protein FJ012_01740 [Chloroflexi bacterium]|nr:hypothetical protein [Chloroflexota bacterium]
MDKMRRGAGFKVLVALGILLLLVAFVLPQAVIAAGPSHPCRFWGTVKVDGNWVASGTLITAWIEGTAGSWTANTGSEAGQPAYAYVLTVYGDEPSTPTKDGGVDGDVVRFTVRYGGHDYVATQTGVWSAGEYKQVNLEISLVAATLSGQPTGMVNYRTANITVGGDGVVAYKYKLDSGAWGAETPVVTLITLSGLADGAHTVYVIGKDSFNNWQAEANATTASWSVDATNPTVTLNNIADFVKTLPSISGTAADTAPGQVDKVQVQVKNTTDSTYWNGTTTWVAGETWLNADGTTSWSYAMPSLTNGKAYEVKAKSIDTAGNESAAASDSFTFDATNPTVTLNDIADLVKSLASISGTAADTAPGQVDKVQVQVRNTTDSTYWNGSSWVAGEAWLNATGTTSWSYAMPSLTNGKAYEVKAKAIDKAGSESSVASDSFIFDTANPTVTLNNIPDFVNSLASISGTAADAAPGQVDKVQVQIKNTTDSTYWNGSSWVAGETWLNATGTASWSYSMPSLVNGKAYEVKAKAIDKSGNESSVASDSFTFDAANPTVTLNNIPDFVNSLASISGTAADTAPGQVDKVQVQIKNATDSTYWNGSSWVAGETWLNATGTTSWSYSMPSLVNGKAYEVKAKAIDKAGNESSVASDSFTLDTVPPAITVARDGLSFSGTATDATSYIASVQYRLDGGGWVNATASDGAFNGPSEGYSFTLAALADGSRTVDVRASDAAGNLASQSLSFQSKQLYWDGNKGWNSVAYLGPDKPLTEALSSIGDKLSVVWFFDSETGKWYGYNPNMPAWANDLAELKNNQSYWIKVTSGCYLTYGG